MTIDLQPLLDDPAALAVLVAITANLALIAAAIENAIRNPKRRDPHV
jgi:hypothetical protein